MGNAPKMTMSLIMNSSRAYLEKRTWNMSSSAENIKCFTQQGPASPTLPNGGKEGRCAFMSLLVVIPVAIESSFDRDDEQIFIGKEIFHCISPTNAFHGMKCMDLIWV